MFKKCLALEDYRFKVSIDSFYKNFIGLSKSLRSTLKMVFILLCNWALKGNV